MSGSSAATASPAPEPAAGTTRFESTIYPYSLTLPAGWSVVAASQEPGSDHDLFTGPEGDARVGTGVPEPGQTAVDRVATNRADLPPDCTSEPDSDWSTTLGGEDAIGWSWRCTSSYAVAVNAIHDGLGYRLSVSVPLGSAQAAPPLLEQLRQGFAFSGDPNVPTTTSADLAALDAQLQGTYETAWHPTELDIATLEAAGLELSGSPWEAEITTAADARFAVKFEEGRLTLYIAYDGGPLEVGWVGRY